MHPIKNEKGFTLIELMIAMIIMVLALLSYLSTTNVIQNTSEAAYERNIAIQDANRTFEQIRETAGTGNFPDDLITSFPNNGTVAGFNNLTNETVTVSYANTIDDPLDTSITVTWLEDGQRNASITLRSFITQR